MIVDVKCRKFRFFLQNRTRGYFVSRLNHHIKRHLRAARTPTIDAVFNRLLGDVVRDAIGTQHFHVFWHLLASCGFGAYAFKPNFAFLTNDHYVKFAVIKLVERVVVTKVLIKVFGRETYKTIG